MYLCFIVYVIRCVVGLVIECVQLGGGECTMYTVECVRLSVRLYMCACAGNSFSLSLSLSISVR